MFPSAPLSPPQRIECHAGHTEMFMHLKNIMHGAPCPTNVLTDVDPCTAAPSNLPRNIFFFFNSDNDTSLQGENGIRITEGGYWHVTGKDPRALIQSPTNGRITTLEFYEGQAPRGDKTNWVMHGYTMDKLLGSSTLCKVFNRNDGNHFEERQLAVADDANGELVEAILLGMLEDEENTSDFQNSSNICQGSSTLVSSVFNRNDGNHFEERKQAVADDDDGELLEAILISMLEDQENARNFQDSSNICQVLSRNEHVPPAISGSHVPNLRPHNSAWVPVEDYDLSREDILELDDLVGSSSSSSSSGNTRVSSMSLDETFDPADLLRVLDTTQYIPGTNKQNVDCCRFGDSASRGSHQVLVRPPPSGSLGGSSGRSSNNNQNPRAMKAVVSAPMPSICIGGLNQPPAAIVGGLSNRKAFKHESAACHMNKMNQGPSTSQDAVSAKASHGRKAAGTIAKFAKKYCCFM